MFERATLDRKNRRTDVFLLSARFIVASLLYPVVELFEFTVYPPLQCFSVCARRKLVEIVEGGTIPFIFCLFWNLVLMNKCHLGLYGVH